jgi:hypothetical protein
VVVVDQVFLRGGRWAAREAAASEENVIAQRDTMRRRRRGAAASEENVIAQRDTMRRRRRAAVS